LVNAGKLRKKQLRRKGKKGKKGKKSLKKLREETAARCVKDFLSLFH
jgi:hypothetical protein